MPFIPEHSEADVLQHFERALASVKAAAVYVEPMQGRGGGYSASKDFYRELQQLCSRHGVLIICDEIFSGFYRTGPCFCYPSLGIDPDIVLIGKAIANGFPAAGLLLDKRLKYHSKDFRLSSTFSDIAGVRRGRRTLSEMERIGIEDRVAQIERSLGKLDGGPTSQLRLRGAACFVELDSQRAVARAQDYLYRHNILALGRGAILGFWPPATISNEHLDRVVSCERGDGESEVISGGSMAHARVLSAEQQRFYRASGYLVVPELAPEPFLSGVQTYLEGIVEETISEWQQAALIEGFSDLDFGARYYMAWLAREGPNAPRHKTSTSPSSLSLTTSRRIGSSVGGRSDRLRACGGP